MVIAVMHKGDHLVSAARMDGTGLLAVDGVIGKAYTAAAFGRPAYEMAACPDAPLVFASTLTTVM